MARARRKSSSDQVCESEILFAKWIWSCRAAGGRARACLCLYLCACEGRRDYVTFTRERGASRVSGASNETRARDERASGRAGAPARERLLIRAQDRARATKTRQLHFELSSPSKSDDDDKRRCGDANQTRAGTSSLASACLACSPRVRASSNSQKAGKAHS